MAQPNDRTARVEVLGEVDEEAGEFWSENTFLIQREGNNLSSYERNPMFLNLGGESFLDVSFATPASIDSDSRSVIAADFDRDGWTDLLVASVGGGPLRLFSNQFPRSNRRVRIDLVGTTSNLRGIGSRVVVRVGAQSIVRDVFLANGFSGQSPADLLIGVGDAKVIDELTVRWPTGKEQRFQNVPVDRRITITEGNDGYQESDGF